MKLVIAAVFAVALLGPARRATADDEVVETAAEPAYAPLSFGFPQIGLGMVTRGDNQMELGTRAFDATARWSPAWSVVPRLRVGGFVEARTASFDGLEVGVGPHVMVSLHELWAVQLRGGVASVVSGGAYGLAGVQVGTPLVSVTVTGRRYFEDDHLELSVNLELSTVLALLPFLKLPIGG